jgi:DNA-binding response OmpR family regulator
MPNALIMLLVSDSVARVVIEETLEKGGYAVMSAGDLGTAVKRMSESAPDILIVSTYIEDISGYDTAKFLRTKYHGLPVLMVAGIIDDERLEYRLELEGFEVFPKPYAGAELLAKVKEMVSRVEVLGPSRCEAVRWCADFVADERIRGGTFERRAVDGRWILGRGRAGYEARFFFLSRHSSQRVCFSTP